MPSSETILIGLTAIANDWRALAITWHVLLGAVLVALFAGWRPSPRVIGHMLVAPILSVSLLAWQSGNPFNGIVFTLLALMLVATATRVSNASIQFGSPLWIVAGAVFITYGWAYPHFLRTDSWTAYLYASPFGLVPCPTLSVVIGLTLVFRAIRSRVWDTSLVVAGLIYAAVGVFRLGVLLDWGLLFAAITLAAALMRDDPGFRSVRERQAAERDASGASAPGHFDRHRVSGAARHHRWFCGSVVRAASVADARLAEFRRRAARDLDIHARSTST